MNKKPVGEKLWVQFVKLDGRESAEDKDAVIVRMKEWKHF